MKISISEASGFLFLFILGISVLSSNAQYYPGGYPPPVAPNNSVAVPAYSPSPTNYNPGIGQPAASPSPCNTNCSDVYDSCWDCSLDDMEVSIVVCDGKKTLSCRGPCVEK
ncbi:MAG: hypothetical protein A3B68_07265 [Candidatus Melainabacteria bacterium RIFCSPHIGHO2_02_FULL_34_12]|nr:MAG: hypothetical protein A3B68_07265 [Candidatus Melainabacteria bacterium RIFCSPHIGHO2_02_FULL_34_12]